MTSEILHTLGAYVKHYAVDLAPGSETDFADSLGGSWYISPTQHAIEFLTLAPMYLGFAAYFGWRAFNKSTPAYRLLTSTEKLPPRPLLETLCLVLLIASFSTTVAHKAVTGTLMFLMQPCHVSAGLLILVMSWPDHKYPIIPRVLFNIYLHTLWGAILALIWPDLRDHEMLGEVFNFFMEHVLVLVLPFYMVLSRRYVVMPLSLDMALFSFFLYAAYHSPVLHLSSLLSGFNLNYALVPPALTFLIASGPWYRGIMYFSALLLMFITRYGLVENFLLLVHGIQIMIQKKKKSA
ncbi:TMEM164 family-domain-containing protein [Zychaea mexicana]|uniref:TMEM164 family-domain-containing protein n=1 Tax=Zychaea mexicana TaxID=64656 RepID=UPI0022FEA270|nr:TMEM164 family-domain-containing protein [Zychaea mexicana]KAI9484866.1 TMEM164 family-domain-containing protein [Zychaea mexicana]